MSNRTIEVYRYLEDEEELKWFFKHVVIPLKPYEEYCFCNAARAKKLTEEERLKYELGRAEMLDPENVTYKNFSYESFRRAILKYEVNKEARVTRSGLPYPDKTLVVYFYPNPCSTIKVMQSIKEHIASLDDEFVNSTIKQSKGGVDDTIMKVGHFLHKIKRLYPVYPSTTHYLDFDMDLENDTDKEKALSYLKDKFSHTFTKGNYFIIKTTGGYHILLKKEALSALNSKGIKFNPKKWCKEIEEEDKDFSLKEFVFNTNKCIPCPGTLQYGNLVTVENKEDFE